MQEVVKFLDKNLPRRIKDELFFKNQIALKPFFICDALRQQGFIIGMTDDPKDLFFPKEYLLLWTKLQRFLSESDTLSFEQEKYRLITINTACKMLDVTRPTLYKLLNEKKIPFVQILSQRRIQLKNLLDYIEENKKYV
jgi:excisionase family DNA binding protein